VKRSLLAVALLPALVWAPVARAGTYTVTACSLAPGHQNNSWQLFNEDIEHLTTGQSCPPAEGEGEGAKTTGMFATDSLTGTGNAASGASAGWQFTAPPGMSIVAVQADRYLGAYGDDGWVPSLSADGKTLESCTFSYPQESCGVGEPFGNVNSLGPTLSVEDATTVTSEITCTGSKGCVPGATIHHAWAALYGASVTLSETTEPTLPPPSGSLWDSGASNGYHKDTEALSFNVTDPSGISQVTLAVDGHQVASAEGVCNYTYPIPCQPLSGTLALNTATLTDGPHTLTLTAYDAAHNQAQITHAIVTANTPPGPPVGLQAVRAMNGTYTITWNDPADVTPITGATYQLCPLPSGVCQAAQGVPAADQQGSAWQLSGLQAPAGRWQINVWLTDAAANSDPANTALVELPQPAKPPPRKHLARLKVHHTLRGRRLTVFVTAPAGVRGLVKVSYRAVRGHKTLARGEQACRLRARRARCMFKLPKRAARASRVYIHPTLSAVQETYA
jgi:hypothetical protein